ncbi:MAG: hypothetical protein NVS9B15_01170 [Acidobacteriaceae bacterium]
MLRPRFLANNMQQDQCILLCCMALLPTDIPSFINDKTGEVNVIIETPRGSRVKYAWDKEREIFAHKRLLPLGMVFPYDFGFVPSTIAEDGDPIDVLVLIDEPVAVGTLIEATLIGVIRAEQTEPIEGKKKMHTDRNDRLLAIGKLSHDYSGIENPEHLRPGTIEQIQAFFKQYNKLFGKKFKPLEVGGKKAAIALVKDAQTPLRKAA